MRCSSNIAPVFERGKNTDLLKTGFNDQLSEQGNTINVATFWDTAPGEPMFQRKT
jgi:hypothetical protein